MKRESISRIWVGVLAVALIVCVACGPAQESKPVSTGNQPPVILSMTLAQNQTYPGGTVNIQSVVNDPENDVISYKWTSTGGSFIEQGRANTTWRAPSNYGDYEIKLIVDDGKGASAQSTSIIKVSANHPPAITSLTADPASLQFASMTTLTCIATDQDGDTVKFKWEAREGTLSGEGNKVSWVSPSKNGSYSVFVIASDGKGAETRQEIVIPVAAASGVQTFQLVTKESGTVSSLGDKDPTVFKAGDDENNVGYRAFFSYNTFPLIGKDIKQARLKFVGTRVVGENPYDAVGGVGDFKLLHFSWPEGTMPAFNIVGGGPLQRYGDYLNKQADEVDVTPELINTVENRLNRFQVEAAFTKRTSNGDGNAQYVQWTDVVLEVTSSDK